jgi:flagellar protein FliS
MHDARSAYLETQVLTAAPQKLRLMLIDACIRFAHQARDSHVAGDGEQFSSSLERARDIVTELISAIRPDGTSLTEAARGVYAFIFKSLAEAQLLKDAQKIDDALRVLEEERQTWLAVCELELEAPASGEAANFRQQEVFASDPLSPTVAAERFSLDA